MEVILMNRTGDQWVASQFEIGHSRWPLATTRRAIRRPDSDFLNLAAEARASHTGPNQQKSWSGGPIGICPPRFPARDPSSALCPRPVPCGWPAHLFNEQVGILTACLCSVQSPRVPSNGYWPPVAAIAAAESQSSGPNVLRVRHAIRKGMGYLTQSNPR